MDPNVFHIIASRRSCRKYKPKKVPEDLLYSLVEAGMKAPSSGNLQDYSFIIVQDDEKIEKVASLSMGQTWMTSAPALIIVCSKPSQQAEWYGERGRHVFSIQNAAAATQNILLAAHASGLGACWVGGFDQQAIDDMFKASPEARVEAIITVGYSDERIKAKDEKSIELLMYFDEYGNDKPDKLLLNKDYSLKMEQKAKQYRRRADSFSKRLRRTIEELKDQFNNPKK